MVNKDWMYASTPACPVCGKSALIPVKISEYLNWKLNPSAPMSMPEWQVEQLTTGQHIECEREPNSNEMPLTPEEEEMAPPDASMGA